MLRQYYCPSCAIEAGSLIQIDMQMISIRLSITMLGSLMVVTKNIRSVHTIVTLVDLMCPSSMCCPLTDRTRRKTAQPFMIGKLLSAIIGRIL